MDNIFNTKNTKKLQKLASMQVLYAFDFDGTLARITHKIQHAHLSPKTEKLLIELSKHVPIAIISGRGIQDLRSRTPKQIRTLIGNHGLEGLPGDQTKMSRAKMICAEWVKTLFKPGGALQIEGVEFENKKFSLAVHFRLVKNKKKAKRALYSTIQNLRPKPHIVGGKLIFNLLPVDSVNKGSALQKLMKIKNLKHAVFVGDDDTDEDVFRLKSRRIMKIRVGKKNKSHANHYLKNQTLINQFLKTLIKLQANSSPQLGHKP